jgi:hypothetical protein
MMMTATQDISKERDLLTFIYDAFNRRDIAPILNVMHPEVEWPNGMEGGWVSGREGVRAYWTRQWSIVNPRVYPVRFGADENGRIVTNVHQIVCDLAGKVLLDRIVQHVYFISDGLIRRMDIRE